MSKSYIHRSMENDLLKRAKEFPVIVLTGPRQTGKSTMLRKIFPSHNYISFDDPLIKNLAAQDPKLFLENNPAPLLIDEIQYVPELLPYIKIEVDSNRSLHGRYILTGSQIFGLMAGISESLAGRAVLYELLGFSFEELSTKKLINNTFSGCFKTIYKGFFPEPCVHNVDPTAFYSSYVQTYLERDIRQIRSVHDLRLFQQFLELLAARVGSLLNLNEISKECGISHTTAKKWLSLLESTRIIYLLRPYHKNISKRVIKSPKLYFTDTGLLSYLLKYPDEKTLSAGPIAGHLFENIMIMEALKYKFNTNKRYELYFYRDSTHNEIDLVLDFGHSLKLIEFKSSKSIRNEHWKSLMQISKILKPQASYIVSFFEDELTLSRDIYCKPWWKITDILTK